MPIHDQGYRRYAGRRAPHGRAWWTIARTQSCVAVIPSGRSSYCSCSPGCRSSRAACSSICRRASSRCRCWRPRRRRSGTSSDQQGLFVFLVTIALGGAIADDRRANALQLYSLEAADADGVHHRPARAGAGLPARRHVRAGDTAAAAADRVLRQHQRSCGRTCSCCRRSRSSRLRRRSCPRSRFWHCRRCPRAAGSSRSCTRASSSSPRRCTRCCAPSPAAVHGRRFPPETCWTSWLMPSSVFARTRRCRVPVAILVIVLLIARLLLGARAARACRGDRRVTAIATEHLSKWYGQVSGLNDVTCRVPPWHYRPARSERRRQVDVHEAR